MTKQLIKRTNLKQLFKKAISIATAVSALAAASVTPVSAQNIIDAGANNIIFNDFSSTSGAWVMTNSGDCSTELADSMEQPYNSVYKMTNTTQWATLSDVTYTFDTAITNKVLKLSCDTKAPESINANFYVSDESNTEVFLLRVLQNQAYFLDNWQSGIFNPQSKEGWNHIDVIINQETGALKCYINGALRREETTENETVLNIKSVRFTQACGPWTMFDNLMISTDEDNRAFGAINYVRDEENNAVYAQLSSSIPSDQNLPTATVKKVGSGDTVTAAVTKYASDTIKIDYSGTELESGAEYMVEFESPITDISGKTLEPLIFNAPQKTVTKQILSTGIDESEWRLASGQDKTLPKNWSQVKGWGDNAEIGKTTEPDVTPENNVLIFKDPYADLEQRALKYTFPEVLPDNCELKVSYRTKQHPTDDGSMAESFYFATFVGDSVNSNEDALMVAQDFYNPGDSHNGGITIATGSAWWCHGGETLINAEDYKFDKWYTIEVTYHIDGVNRAKADYVIKDESGAVVAQASNKLTATDNIIKPNSITFQSTDSTKTKQPYDYLDDIKVSYSYKEAAQPTIRLIGADNSSIVPTSPLKNNFKAFSVLFAGEQQENTVSATLTEGGNNVALTKEKVGAGLKYNFNLTEFLKPSTTYTFTLNYGGEKTYTYNFTTESSDKIDFSDFGFYKADGTKINSMSELSDGDVITVKTRAYNATGDSTKKACISAAAYGDDFLKDVMVDEKTITGSVDGVELSASVTYHTGMNKVLGFLWDGLSTLRPYADSISL